MKEAIVFTQQFYSATQRDTNLMSSATSKWQIYIGMGWGGGGGGKGLKRI